MTDATTSRGDVLITTLRDMQLDNILAPLGTVYLQSGFGIYDHRGIVQVDGRPTNIDAQAAVVNARTGVGTSADRIDTASAASSRSRWRALSGCATAPR